MPKASKSSTYDSDKLKKRITTKKRILTPDKIEELNRKLNEIEVNKHIYEITYFKKDQKKEGGSYITIKDIITKINPIEEYLLTKNKTKIHLTDIIEVNNI